MSKDSSKQFYRQCRYERQLGGGAFEFDVSWIREELARVGARIYFGERRAVTDDEIWTVVEVGTNRRALDYLHFKSNADRHQREASDV